ncbi:MAG: hypothetical protein KDB87_20380, partial [Flavobacteriales bacterium]|nr:hypothetical protein [Flavobacteriales bacterium]
MAQLACVSPWTQHQPPVHDEATAQAGAQRHHQQIVHPLASPVTPFTQGGRVGIVAQRAGNAHPLLHHRRQGHVALPRQVGRPVDAAGMLVAVGGADAYRSWMLNVGGWRLGSD